MSLFREAAWIVVLAIVAVVGILMIINAKPETCGPEEPFHGHMVKCEWSK